jgi:hypothetical protein
MIIRRTFSDRISISMTEGEARDVLEILTVANNIKGRWAKPNRIRALSNRIAEALIRETLGNDKLTPR